jgi:hypothetical protein
MSTRKRICFWMTITILAITLLNNKKLFALEKYFFIKAGKNISKFRNIDCKKGYGNLFGVGLGFEPNKRSLINGFGSIELTYIQKKAILENVSRPPNEWVRDSVVFSNYYMSYGYIQLPVKFGYLFRFLNECKIKLFTGPSFDIAIINKSKAERIGRVDLKRNENGNYPDYPYDYELYDKELPIIFVNTQLGYHFGALLEWRHVNFELCYSAITNTNIVIGLNAYDTVDTISMSLGYRF